MQYVLGERRYRNRECARFLESIPCWGRTEIASFSHQDVVNLQNGHSIITDIVILCTGFDKGYKAFTKELQEECGLYYDNTEYSGWTKLDARGEQKVDELLPFLRNPPSSSTQAKAQPAHGPSRHYRRLIVPHLAAQGDRSILFLGLIHSVFMLLIGELQVLWGVAFMLGWFELPYREGMEQEAATFNAWTRKRYLEQGKKQTYFIYDYLSVSTSNITPIRITLYSYTSSISTR